MGTSGYLKQPVKIMFQETLRDRILRVLYEKGPQSTRGLAEVLKTDRMMVKDKLLVAKSHQHVVDKWVKRPTPTGYMVMTHSYYITDRGIEWLKERGIISS